MFNRLQEPQDSRLPVMASELGSFAGVLFAHSPDGIIVLDSIGKIVAVNKAMCDIVGDTKENLVGLLPKFLFAGSARSEAYKTFIHDLVTKGVWSGQVNARISDGSILPMDLGFYSVMNAVGEVMHYVGIAIAHLAGENMKGGFNPNFDPLTGLLSGFALKPRLEHILARAEKYMSVTTLAYINIDNFSKLNQGDAHLGDEVLKGVAEVLKKTLDKSYAIARLKADTFAVVIQDIYNQDELSKIVERVRSALVAPDAVAEGVSTLSFSIGVASYPFSGDNVEEILSAAKNAAAGSKALGGGRIMYHKLFSEAAAENSGEDPDAESDNGAGVWL